MGGAVGRRVPTAWLLLLAVVGGMGIGLRATLRTGFNGGTAETPTPKVGGPKDATGSAIARVVLVVDELDRWLSVSAPARRSMMATTTAPHRRLTRTPAHRAGHLRCPRMRVFQRPRPSRAARVRRVQPPARPRSARPTHRTRAADRPARRGGPDQPRDRPAPLPLTPHDRDTPLPRLPQAQHHRTHRTGHGTRYRDRPGSVAACDLQRLRAGAR
jgi:hypothetical protein